MGLLGGKCLGGPLASSSRRSESELRRAKGLKLNFKSHTSIVSQTPCHDHLGKPSSKGAFQVTHLSEDLLPTIRSRPRGQRTARGWGGTPFFCPQAGLPPHPYSRRISPDPHLPPGREGLPDTDRQQQRCHAGLVCLLLTDYS